MHMVPHSARDTDAAWRAFALESHRNIHTVTVYVGSLGDHVADVDADPEADGPVGSLLAIDNGRLLLHGHGTAYSALYAVEHDQQRVAGGLGNSAAMLVYRRINQGAAQHLKSCNRARVVKVYQAAIADHVNVNDGDQLSTVCGSSEKVRCDR